MGVEIIQDRVEAVGTRAIQLGTTAVEGIGRVLESRNNRGAQYFGAGLMDLVDPDISILNRRNWSEDYTRS